MTLKAPVKAGRLVVDEPTDLPEGTEIELLRLDPGDWLDEEDGNKCVVLPQKRHLVRKADSHHR